MPEFCAKAMATVDPISVSITTPCPSTSNSELSLSSLAASALEDSDSEHQEQQPNKLSPYDKHPYTLSKDTDLGYASATGSTISLGTATKTVVSQTTTTTTTTTTTSPSPPISPLASILQTSPSSPTPSASISHNAPTTSSEVDMMASLDEVLMRKSAPTSDYYSTGGSDSGHDEATSRDTSTEQHQQSHEQVLQPQDKNHSRLSTTGSDADLIDRERDFRAQHEENTPTLEQMGLDKLDELELRMLLQNAYEVIQEKERGKDPNTKNRCHVKMGFTICSIHPGIPPPPSFDPCALLIATSSRPLTTLSFFFSSSFPISALSFFRLPGNVPLFPTSPICFFLALPFPFQIPILSYFIVHIT